MIDVLKQFEILKQFENFYMEAMEQRPERYF